MHAISRVLVLLLFFCAAVLHLGTVRRKQTHMTKAQTEGIKLKDKLEELKDGEKGPATPSFGWYGGENGFMGEPPLNREEEPARIEVSAYPTVSEVDLPLQGTPAVVESDKEDSGEDEVWDEDWDSDDSAKEDEALSAKDDIEGDADSVESAPSRDTPKDKESSKWDKDWWDEI